MLSCCLLCAIAHLERSLLETDVGIDRAIIDCGEHIPSLRICGAKGSLKHRKHSKRINDAHRKTGERESSRQNAYVIKSARHACSNLTKASFSDRQEAQIEASKQSNRSSPPPSPPPNTPEHPPNIPEHPELPRTSPNFPEHPRTSPNVPRQISPNFPRMSPNIPHKKEAYWVRTNISLRSTPISSCFFAGSLPRVHAGRHKHSMDMTCKLRHAS